MSELREEARTLPGQLRFMSNALEGEMQKAVLEAANLIDRLRALPPEEREPVAMTTDDDGEVLYADGFEDALLGIGVQFNTPLAVYSYERCIGALMSGGTTREDAEEYFSFNVQGAYVGPRTPVFVYGGVTDE